MKNGNARAQASLEFIMLFSAFIAATLVLMHAGTRASKSLLEKTGGLSARLEAEGLCFELDFFSSNARNAVKRAGNAEISAAGNALNINESGAKCISKVGSAGNRLGVRRNAAEAR